MFKKNTAVTGFVVGLVSATDGSDITTGTPVGYYTLDGGAQTAIGDVTPVHEGNGMWSFDLLAAEMNGDVVGLTFTHGSAITAHFTIKTDTKITSELNDVAATDIVSSGAITTSAGAVSTVSTLSGHTAQTGDSYARLGAPAGASVSADLVVIDNFVDGIETAVITNAAGVDIAADIIAVKAETASILTDTGTTLDTKINDIQGATFSSATDSLEAIRDRGDSAWTTGAGGSPPQLLQNTTIATLASQTSFTLTAGSADDDAYNGAVVVVTDSVTAEQKAVGSVIDYTGSTKTVTLTADPAIFTMAAGDTIDIIANASTAPTAADVADAVADEILSGHTTAGSLGQAITDIETKVGNISSGSAAISTASASATVTTGTETLTYAVTDQLDGVLHEVADVGGVTEYYYEFSVGGNGVPVEFLWDGYAQSNGDSYAVKARNWAGSVWDQIGTITAVNGTTIFSATFQATSSHVGTGADLGKVRLQFTSADGTHFATDRVLCSYAVVAQSVGYAGGQVWINTVSGVAGTESYINGVADNQVLTLADAITIAAALPLDKFAVSNASTITFAEAHTNEVWNGDGWTLALGSQDISNTHIYHCNDVAGIGTSATGEVHILDSHIGAITLGQSHITGGSFKSTFTAGAAGAYHVEGAKSGVAGSGSPTLTYSGLGSATTINVRAWQGGGIWVFDSDCTASIEVPIGGTHTITTGGGDIEFRGAPKALSVVTSGTGTTNVVVWSGVPIAISGTGGTVNVYGMHNGITDTSSGTTVTDFGVDVTLLDDVLLDTAEIGAAGAGLTGLGGMSPTMKAQVQVEADASLVTYDAPTNTEMEARTPTAAQLAYITANSATGMPVTFTTSGGSTTAAVIALIDGSAGSATDDQYNGRLLVFTDGTLKGVVTDITDYVGSTTTATITAIPFAPTASHNARLI